MSRKPEEVKPEVKTEEKKPDTKVDSKKDENIAHMNSLATAITLFVNRTTKPFDFIQDHAILLKVEKGIFKCSVVAKK